MRTIGRELGHAQPAESLGSFANDGVSLKNVDALDERRVAWCASQSFQLAGDGSSSGARTIRKLRAAIVSIDVEEFTTMFHRIFDIATTRRDDARRGYGVCRRHDTPFRRGEAIGADEDILSASRAKRRHFVENVIFLKYLRILLARCSNHVAPHGIASLCAIRRDVEKGPVVVGPCGSVPNLVDRIDNAACAEVFNGYSTREMPLGLRGTAAASRRAHVEAAERMELLVARQLVLIEDDLFGRLERAFFPTVNRVGLSLLRSGVIPVAA